MDLEDQRRNCPGYLDQYGIWNNGFECPTIGNEIRVCCGSDSYRYCCLLEDFHNNSSKRSFSSTSEFFRKIHLTFPIQFISLLLLIFLLLIILILIIVFFCYRSHQRRTNLFDGDPISTKEILPSEHFPFTPPHHQIYFTDMKSATSTSSFTIGNPSQCMN